MPFQNSPLIPGICICSYTAETRQSFSFKLYVYIYRKVFLCGIRVQAVFVYFLCLLYFTIPVIFVGVAVILPR